MVRIVILVVLGHELYTRLVGMTLLKREHFHVTLPMKQFNYSLYLRFQGVKGAPY